MGAPRRWEPSDRWSPKGKGKGDAGVGASGKGGLKGKGKEGPGAGASGKGGPKGKGKGDAGAPGKGGPKGKGKGGAGAGAPGKGGKGAQGKGKGKAKGGDAQAPQAAAGGGDERRKQRIYRLADAFAGLLPEIPELANLFTKDELWQVWECFCEEQGDPVSGFSKVLYMLLQWQVIQSAAGRTKFRQVVWARRDYGQRRPPPDASVEIWFGTRPPALGAKFASPVPKFNMPAKLAAMKGLELPEMRRGAKEYLENNGLWPKDITSTNFRSYLHTVLFVEELQMLFDISLYDLYMEEPLRPASPGLLYRIEVPGLAEKRPSVLRGDEVNVFRGRKRFVGYVHQARLDHVEVSLHESFDNVPPLTVHFTFNRTPLRLMHRAIDELPEQLLTDDPIRRVDPVPDTASNGARRLNEEQRRFVAAAMNHLRPAQANAPSPFTPPLLLWGPPGTGKTTTVVAAIHAILQKSQLARLLVVAPSNPAADLLCERLAATGQLTDRDMLRLVAVSRNRSDIGAAALPFTKHDPFAGCFSVPSLEELKRYKVIVATCTCSGYIRSSLEEGTTKGWFSHIFMDEAAQAMEPEALVPLSMGAPGVRLFLAGDFNQLGPVILSPVAMKYGLDISLMERIKVRITQDHSRMFTLMETYRAHPSILKVYNEPVYAGLLRCRSPESSKDMETWSGCPRAPDGTRHPLIFHHCNGQESRTRDSPSWMNEMELLVVDDYLERLVAHGVQAADIGIISPYYKQCQRLRRLAQRFPGVQVGTTEVYQGREKRVIIISTVRSREESQIQADLRFSLGFLSNFKRTNVALSRAKSLLVVVGNLSLLSRDEQWNQVIRIAKKLSPTCVIGDFTMHQVSYRDRGQVQEENGVAAPAAPQDEGDGVADRPWRDTM